MSECAPCVAGNAELAQAGTVATIPWQIWVSVIGLSTVGAATGGYVASRSVKGALVGGAGGLLGSGLALLLAGTINMYGTGGFHCGAKPSPPSPTPERG
ncbi:hypothetical protein LCGC14_2119600 [marine sediment metagenome]|uniref:Uncharacterized protein n=1 Tax=marine sediment metagenome TaxID=412755 RepID=A0A0F9ERR7_9ZZZZ